MTSFLPIAQLLRAGRAPEHPVAFGRGGEVAFRELESDVAALAADVAKARRGRWLVHSDDPYAAAVALLACAHAGCSALLAPNRLPETLRRLRTGVVGAVLDAGADAGELSGLPLLHPQSLVAAPIPAWRALEREARFAEFLTSGSSGRPRRVAKALRHLDDEVGELERLFGRGVGEDAAVYATVSQQHLYGLLFRVLWPLAAGRPFARDTFLQPSELLPRMERAEACVLVSSPAHLERVRPSELRRLRGRCRAVFSSGGPLAADSAAGVAEALGEAPWEIFGSTETGGVARRRRSPGDGDGDAWTPFGPVAFECAARGGRLAVTSPFASAGAARDAGRQRFLMGDRAEPLPDGRFRLLGRADRVVKIGEHRLSLPEMEAALAAHPHVAEAVLVPLERGGVQRVHAVVVASDAGRAALRAGARRELAARLGEHLARAFPRVLLPRAWRFVDALPRDAQGKVPQEPLRALFAAEPDPPVLEPELRAERRGADWLERELAVPADLAFLEGHFPGQPLVAGVVQMRWALDAAQALLGAAPRVRAIEALKFTRPLRPGDAFRLRVEARAGEPWLRFELCDGAGPLASARCRLATGDAP